MLTIEDKHDVDNLRRFITRLELALMPEPGQTEPNHESASLYTGAIRGILDSMTDRREGTL